jgi:uncharacterized protein with HEPN domain
MLEAAGEAVLFAHNRTRKDLDNDRMLTLSIVKSVELIGKAATRISKEGRDTHPGIPWTDIVAMRNRLIHVYFDIDLDRVWDTITDDLPPAFLRLEKGQGFVVIRPTAKRFSKRSPASGSRDQSKKWSLGSFFRERESVRVFL